MYASSRHLPTLQSIIFLTCARTKVHHAVGRLPQACSKGKHMSLGLILGFPRQEQQQRVRTGQQVRWCITSSVKIVSRFQSTFCRCSTNFCEQMSPTPLSKPADHAFVATCTADHAMMLALLPSTPCLSDCMGTLLISKSDCDNCVCAGHQRAECL